MIQIEKVKNVSPEFIQALNESSRKEWETDQEMQTFVIENSKVIWQISCNSLPLVVVGIIPFRSLLNGNRLWFMSCQALATNKIEALRFMRRNFIELRRMFPGLDAAVRVEDGVACRFARFFNFYMTSVEFHDKFGNFKLFRIGD